MKEAKLGRPSSFKPEIADAICEAVATTDYGIQQICEQNPFMPCQATIYNWLRDFPDFLEKYTRAREVQGERQAYLALQEALKASEAGLGRLKWDARRWHAGKLAPKKYGDKTVQEHVGKDDGPIQLENVTDRDRAAAMMRLLAETKKD